MTSSPPVTMSNRCLCVVLAFVTSAVLSAAPKENARVQSLHAKAEAGDVAAMLKYAEFYHHDYSTPEDLKVAATWYQRAAAKGNVDAQFALGQMYLSGRGVDRDYAQAVVWLRKAAEQKNSAAASVLAPLYESDSAGKKNLVEAFKWHLFAAQAGEGSDMTIVGTWYETGRGTAKNPVQAALWYQRGAEREESDAKEALEKLLAADPALRDKVKAAAPAALKDAFAKAEKGDAEAQALLAKEFGKMSGDLIQDFDESNQWLRKAAEQGNRDAQAELAHHYEDGLGVEASAAEARAWYQKAAEQKDGHAAYSVAKYYEEGNGVEADPKEAAKWYLAGAEAGDAAAQAKVGALYQSGELKPASEAVKWFRRAAEQNDSDGIAGLAKLLYELHDPEAGVWIRKAAETGDQDARNLLVAVEVDEAAKEFPGQIPEGLPVETRQRFVKALKGDLLEQLRIGRDYMAGSNGLPEDRAAGVIWFEKAANHGLPAAQYEAGMAYLVGSGVESDDKKAFAWFQRAVESGAVPAPLALARMYRDGRGTAVDHAAALKYLRLATKVAPNFETAEELTYELLASGDPGNVAEAVVLMKEKSSGSSESMVVLSDLYRDGRGGLAVNPAEAKAWLEKAAAAGNFTARQRVAMAEREAQAAKFSAAVDDFNVGFPAATSRYEQIMIVKEFIDTATERRGDLTKEQLTERVLSTLGPKLEALSAREAYAVFDSVQSYEIERKSFTQYFSPSLKDRLKTEAQRLLDAFNSGQTRNETASALYRRTQAGDVQAEYDLAMVYLKDPVSYDPMQAMYWFKQAAQHGNNDAIMALFGLSHSFYAEGGKAYQAGNYPVARLKLIRAASLGELEAHFWVGQVYEHGLGLKTRDLNEALRWYRSGAEVHDGRALAALARCYADGTGVEKDMVAALKWAQQAAEKGEVLGMRLMAQACFSGTGGLAKSEQEALAWYQKAAAKGDAAAKAWVNILSVPSGLERGNLLFNHAGWVANSNSGEEPQTLISYAAELGQPDAKAWLPKVKTAEQERAWPLQENVSLGITAYQAKNYAEALRMWQAAADAGNWVATCNLANLYEAGEGVPKDRAKSQALWEQAAAAGYARAMFVVRDRQAVALYHAGDNAAGGGRFEEALKSWEAAAALGNAASMAALAGFYEGYYTGQPDVEKAVAWIDKAKLYGRESDPDYVARLKSRLNHLEDVKRGQTLFAKGDFAAAETAFTTAAAAGNTDGMWGLGILFEKRTDGKKDDAQAIHWYNEAASKGMNLAARSAADALSKKSGMNGESR